MFVDAALTAARYSAVCTVMTSASVATRGFSTTTPVTVEHAQFAGQRDGQFQPHGVERVVAEVVAQHRLVPEHQGHVVSPVSIGRVGSVIHSLHDPTYRAGSYPAVVSAIAMCAAVMPEPQ